MNNAVGIIAFVVALLVSVMLHEAGHFATARHFGMKASKFFVGFGPTLWSFQRGETEYGIKAIPAGGFVKIEGMTQLEEIDPADADRAFFKQAPGRRAIVLVAGSFMHFVIAVVLIYGVLLALGTQQGSPNVIGGTSCVSVTGTPCAAGAPPGPAQQAGLRGGDKVISFDGVPITAWDQFTQLVRNHKAGPATIVVERDGTRLTYHPVLQEVRRDRLTGRAGNDQVGAIGLYQGIQTNHIGPVDAVGKTFTVIGTGITGTYDTIVHKVGDVGNLFSDHRDPNGLVGVVGAARAGGEVLSTQGETAGQRIGDFLILVAGVNLAVGLFNLLPLLPLDGGHLAILGFEQARHGLRRLRGYRGPVRRVDLVKLLPATYAVVAFFVILSLLILTADIFNPIRINQ